MVEKTFCVFDVVGRYGDVFNLFKDYRIKALRAGVALDMKAYREELDAIAAFRRGECDLVSLSDVGVRQFNRFTGSVSAIGAVPHYGDLKVLTYTLANRRLSPLLQNDEYEVLGVLPLGSVYLYVKDRSIDTVEELAGQRITVFPNHSDARHMVEYVHAQPVPTPISKFAELFNGGAADISYAPAAAYEVLEMSEGMGARGGIVRYPLGQFTAQLVAHKDAFPERFVKRSRKLVASLFSDALRITFRYERAIPDDRWIDIPDVAKREYQEMLRQVRLDILDGNAGPDVANVYHPKMLKLLRKIRCHTNPAAAECRAEERE
ncbi:DUF6091 family protein [Marinobacteraceae bacterium S3BR75-40.1]